MFFRLPASQTLRLLIQKQRFELENIRFASHKYSSLFGPPIMEEEIFSRMLTLGVIITKLCSSLFLIGTKSVSDMFSGLVQFLGIGPGTFSQ